MRQRPHPYSTQILGVFPLNWIADVAQRSDDPQLIIRVINFELVQPICSRYVNVTDGQTDGRRDGRPTIAIPGFALRASRGNNNNLIYLHEVFYLISATKFVHHLAKTKKLHSFFSASLFLFNVSIPCFCATLSSRTVRINSLPDLILISVFNLRDLYYRGF